MSPTREETCTPTTTPSYWDASWKLMEAPDPVDPNSDAPENRLQRAMHVQFRRALGERCAPGARLIEIGCGGSRWLPYFRRTFGYEISGIDYSVAGVHLLQRILEKAQLSATVVQGDLFEPPDEMIERFDVVTSFGVIEHFDHTAGAVEACARYLRPGGIMITEVPTMRGLYGLMYRLLWPAVYRVHVPQSAKSMAKAHADAGLHVMHCRYLLGLPAVLTRPSKDTSPLRRLAFALSSGFSWMERRGLSVPPNLLTSPYVLCIASKPGR